MGVGLKHRTGISVNKKGVALTTPFQRLYDKERFIVRLTIQRQKLKSHSVELPRLPRVRHNLSWLE